MARRRESGGMEGSSRRRLLRRPLPAIARGRGATLGRCGADDPRAARTVGRRTHLAGEQAPQHEREDAAVTQVLALLRRVEADSRAELLLVRAHRDLARVPVVDADDGEAL